MIFVITTSIYIYAGAACFVLLIALLLKFFYAAQTKGKFKEYQSEIARSHSKILKLEVKNEKLQQQIQELQSLQEMAH